jgi:hypothetical protein
MENVMSYDLKEVSALAEFMVKAAARPENRATDGRVSWDFVSADVYLDYEGDFDEEMIEEAIDLILEAAEELPTIH